MPLSLLTSAVAMMLGWGLRGFIGGGPFGAMIPGAMFGLTLLLVRPHPQPSLFAAYAAIAIGFGGEMTYGQTVGFIVQRETFWWGFLGLAVKGGVWGALAAPFLALGWNPPPRLLRTTGLLAIVATSIGWHFINEPKLIYFSNPLDRPRPEIWAGFLLAALATTALLRTWQLTLAGFLGGALGFGFGGAIQGLGRIFTPDLNLHWWKYMEFFFGFLLGYALARAFSPPAPAPEDESPPRPFFWHLASAPLLVAAFVFVANIAQARFGYMLVAIPVLIVITRFPWLAAHAAYTTTFFAFALNVTSLYPAIAATVPFALFALQIERNPRHMFLYFTWAAVFFALIKFATGPQGIAGLLDHIALAFVLMAAWLTWAVLRNSRLEPQS